MNPDAPISKVHITVILIPLYKQQNNEVITFVLRIINPSLFNHRIP